MSKKPEINEKGYFSIFSFCNLILSRKTGSCHIFGGFRMSSCVSEQTPEGSPSAVFFSFLHLRVFFFPLKWLHAEVWSMRGRTGARRPWVSSSSPSPSANLADCVSLTVPSASLFPGDGPRSKTLLSACETQRLITGICLVAFSQVRLVKGTRNWNLACGGTRD